MIQSAVPFIPTGRTTMLKTLGSAGYSHIFQMFLTMGGWRCRA